MTGRAQPPFDLSNGVFIDFETYGGGAPFARASLACLTSATTSRGRRRLLTERSVDEFSQPLIPESLSVSIDLFSATATANFQDPMGPGTNRMPDLASRALASARRLARRRWRAIHGYRRGMLLAVLVGSMEAGCAHAPRSEAASRPPVPDPLEARYQSLLAEARAAEQRQYLALAEQARRGGLTSGTGFDFTNHFPLPPQIARAGLSEDEYNARVQEEIDTERKRIELRQQQVREARASVYLERAEQVMARGPFCEFGGPSRLQLRRAAAQGKTSLRDLKPGR
jgi:hypothetical protein